jgi:hypothetical protein
MPSPFPIQLPNLSLLPETSPTVAPLSTGSPAIDEICGGIPRATLTEIAGNPSSGRTGLLFSLLRQATVLGEFCVLIDVPDAFDPASAASAGVALSRLLWVRCAGNAEHALKASDLLIRAGGFGVVVLDLSGIPARITNRIPPASWFRLRHGAEHSGAALVVTGDRSLAKSCARLQLEVRQERGLWSAKLLRGISAFAKLRQRQQLRAASFHVVR